MSKKKQRLNSASAATKPAGQTKCHTGNVSVMHLGDKAHLYCGGWSRGANSEDVAVIDLTGTEPLDVENPFKARNEAAQVVFKNVIQSAAAQRELPWLAFKIQDFGTPNVKRATWVALANAIRSLMEQGESVLLACNGGHGRTGTAASILCYLLNPDVGDPVTYLRSVYCTHAVETRAQHLYVNQMCNLPEPAVVEYKHDATTQWTYYGGGGSAWQPGDIWDAATGKWVKADAPKLAGNLPEFMSEEKVNRLLEKLEQEHVDHSVAKYLNGRDVEVSVLEPHGEGITYYLIGDFYETASTVKLYVVGNPAQTRTMPISFLAKSEEVEKFYAS